MAVAVMGVAGAGHVVAAGVPAVIYKGAITVVVKAPIGRLSEAVAAIAFGVAVCLYHC